MLLSIWGHLPKPMRLNRVLFWAKEKMRTSPVDGTENGSNVSILRLMIGTVIIKLFDMDHLSILPGKPVAVNFHQLYPQNQPQLPKKMQH